MAALKRVKKDYNDEDAAVTRCPICLLVFDAIDIQEHCEEHFTAEERSGCKEAGGIHARVCSSEAAAFHDEGLEDEVQVVNGTSAVVSTPTLNVPAAASSSTPRTASAAYDGRCEDANVLTAVELPMPSVPHPLTCAHSQSNTPVRSIIQKLEDACRKHAGNECTLLSG